MMTNLVEFSEAQVAAFESVMHDNYRPVQPFNARAFLLTSGLRRRQCPQLAVIRWGQLRLGWFWPDSLPWASAWPSTLCAGVSQHSPDRRPVLL